MFENSYLQMFTSANLFFFIPDFVIDKICNNKFDELEADDPDEPLEPAKTPEPEPMVKDGEWNPEAAPGAFDAAGEMMPVTPRKRVRRVHGHEVLEEVSAELDFEVPETAFLTKEEQEKAVQANAKEEKRRKKLKQEVDKKTRQLMLNLEECVHIYNNNDVSKFVVLSNFFILNHQALGK